MSKSARIAGALRYVLRGNETGQSARGSALSFKCSSNRLAFAARSVRCPLGPRPSRFQSAVREAGMLACSNSAEHTAASRYGLMARVGTRLPAHRHKAVLSHVRQMLSTNATHTKTSTHPSTGNGRAWHPVVAKAAACRTQDRPPVGLSAVAPQPQGPRGAHCPSTHHTRHICSHQPTAPARSDQVFRRRALRQPAHAHTKTPRQRTLRRACSG